MLLHYWRPPPEDTTPVTNFGDELNTVLWPKLLGDSFFDDDSGVMFLGIGSLLGWPKTGDPTRRHRIVFGSGAAFAEAAQREPADERWHFYGVRGPSTVEAYGLDPLLGITDPAILVAQCYERHDPTHRFGYMPHLAEAREWSSMLSDVCEQMGVRYIDPRDDVESVIAAIGSVSVMVAEAMHSAIVADALRVPWVPVYTTRRPHRFKWTDWCSSMDLEYQPWWIGNASSWGARVGVRATVLDRAAGSLFVSRFRRVHHARRAAAQYGSSARGTARTAQRRVGGDASRCGGRSVRQLKSPGKAPPRSSATHHGPPRCGAPGRNRTCDTRFRKPCVGADATGGPACPVLCRASFQWLPNQPAGSSPPFGRPGSTSMKVAVTRPIQDVKVFAGSAVQRPGKAPVDRAADDRRTAAKHLVPNTR